MLIHRSASRRPLSRRLRSSAAWTSLSLATLACALLLASVGASPASALTSGQMFGIQDQSSLAIFNDPLLKKLHPQSTRFLTDWKTALKPSADRAKLDAWYAATLSHRMRPFIALEHFVGRDDYRAGRQIKPPSSKAFKKAFKAFLKRYPKARDYAVWNEANHYTQPLYKHPKDAARLAHVARVACRRCSIVGLTLVNGDKTASIRYAKAYWKALPKADRRTLIWGIHNYRDVNHRVSTDLRFFLKTFPTGKVWITESGGFAQFLSGNYRFNVKRQAQAATATFAAAVKYRSRVKRLYWFQWRGTADANPKAFWDSGLLNSNGTPRPAYKVALKQRFKTR